MSIGNECLRMNQYHWNPIHYVHFPTNSLNEFSKICSCTGCTAHTERERERERGTEHDRVCRYEIALSHALISFAISPNPIHSLHKHKYFFRPLISTNVNMIKLNLGWLNVCAITAHKIQKMASLTFSLPRHLKVNIYTNWVLEESSTCKARWTCSNNNIVSNHYCWCHETICLDWFYHFYCTYALRPHPMQSFPFRSRSSPKRFLIRNVCMCVCVYITNDNRLHFQTFTTFFILMVRVHVCLCVCVRAHG